MCARTLKRILLLSLSSLRFLLRHLHYSYTLILPLGLSPSDVVVVVLDWGPIYNQMTIAIRNRSSAEEQSPVQTEIQTRDTKAASTSTSSVIYADHATSHFVFSFLFCYSFSDLGKVTNDRRLGRVCDRIYYGR